MKPTDFNDLGNPQRIRERVEWGAMIQPPLKGQDGKPPKTPFIPPEARRASSFRNSEPPPREWLVEGWIPASDACLLGADGGTGKTLLGLQIGLACETGSLWLDMAVLDCPVVYYGAEEPWSELHLRYRDVAKPVLYPPLHAFELISVADREDAALIEIGESGKPEPTPMLGWLEGRVRALGARLLILDAAADVCAINENDRNQVRRAVAILRGVAIRNRCAILLLAHPSVEGMKSGRGYSGSTHWNNAVRARMYFTTPISAEGDEIDQDARVLSLEKANRARKGQKIKLRWSEGRFVVDHTNSLENRTAVVTAKETFLAILKQLVAQGRATSVGANLKARNYAPRVFARHPDSSGIKEKLFERAMEELFKDGILKIKTEGPPSKRREYIEITNEIYV
jgi:RecA-family ATPase